MDYIEIAMRSGYEGNLVRAAILVKTRGCGKYPDLYFYSAGFAGRISEA
jgi:hypothetical protein